MTRREMLGLLSAPCTAALAEQNAPDKADFRLKIAPIALEIAPKTIIKTIGYNGSAPGPLLRVKEGQKVTIEVENATGDPEIVHWHGLHIPSEVDGSAEEGTPMIRPHATERYSFIASPAGTRWYHTHTMAMRNLRRGAYTGQFGLLYIEPKREPGDFDHEIFLALREWDPYMSTGSEDEGSMDVMYKRFSINRCALGFGEPIRVKEGQRVMLRILNASATVLRRIAFAGHQFEVVAMDGNPVARPKKVGALELGPGERIDALVDMNQPGVWILGATNDHDRQSGLGIVVEYANRSGAPRWNPPVTDAWDYHVFGVPATAPASEAEKIPLVFQKKFAGNRWVDNWTINGKSWPKTDPIRVREGGRYRLIFDNRSDEAHPVHLHRHTFELARAAGTPTSGVFKDVVVIQPKSQLEVEFTASNPGKTLFHCHQQMHMDYGFMALMEYV